MPTSLEFVIKARNEAWAILAEVSGQAREAIGTVKGEVGDLSSRLADAQTTMRNTGAVMTAAVTAPLVIMGDKAVDAAVSLGESVNAVNVVFGDAADVVHDFAKVAGDEAGLSMRALNEAVVPIGAGLQNMGLSASDAAQASVDLAKRAADMASVYNVDVSEALGAISAGLRGEAEPLNRFGVSLSDAAVRAKAVEMGLADTTAEVDQAGLAQARLALLMEQSDKVAGDFVNTADGLANSQRIDGAHAEDVAASYGDKLIPAKKALADVTRTVVDAFAGLDPAMQTTILGAAGVAAATGPVLLGASQMVGAVGGGIKAFQGLTESGGALSKAMGFLAANPIVLIIAGIAALVAGLIWAYNNSEEFREIVNAVFEAVGQVIGAIVETVVGILTTLGETFATIFGAIQTVVQTVVDVIRTVIETAVGIVGGILTAYLTAWQTLFSTVFGAIKAVVETVLGVIRTVIETVVGVITGIFTRTLEGWQRIFSTVFGAIAGPVRAGLEIVSGVVDTILGTIGGAFEGLGDIVGEVWDRIVSGIKVSINFVIDIVNGFIRALNGIQIHIPGFDTPFGTVARFDWGGLNLGQIPRLDRGAWELLEDSLALVHRGEMVVPAGPASRVREALDGGGAGAFARNVPMVHIETVNGIQPGDLEREIERGIRRSALAWQLGR
ncbi:MAG: hypothetical protein L0227_09810 [Chloroflexi bacterium]|nr:hypothetical protein [Chloroflexota bacterium]